MGMGMDMISFGTGTGMGIYEREYTGMRGMGIATHSGTPLMQARRSKKFQKIKRLKDTKGIRSIIYLRLYFSSFSLLLFLLFSLLLYSSRLPIRFRGYNLGIFFSKAQVPACEF